MEQTTPIKAFRWVVLITAIFYLIDTCVRSSWDPGGPFRYLTIWGLVLSIFVAYRMLLISLGKSDKRFDPIVSATVVVNAMVVFLYWRLYFDDPASVTRNGELGAWWREFYMHGFGPLLMWIDALFINRAFRRFWPAAVALLTTVAGYLTWTEIFVRPLNDSPVGSVTTGLPYPFLNNLVFADRAVFYATNLVVALVLLVVFAGLARLIRRVL